MKKFLTLIGGCLLAASLFLLPLSVTAPKKAEAAPGCAYALYVTAWNNLQLVEITRANGTSYEVPWGFAGPIGLTTGDHVNVVCFFSVCQLPHGFTLGHTVWTHCGISDPPVDITYAPGLMSDYYVAYLTCDCPNPGVAFLYDAMSGYPCQTQQGGGGGGQ